MTGLASGLRILADEGALDLAIVDVPAAHPGIPSPEMCDSILPSPLWTRVPFVRRYPLRHGREFTSRQSRLSSLLRCDVYHCSGVQPFWPAASVPVITLYDTGAIEHPEWHTGKTVEYAQRELGMVRNGARILAISDWSADRAACLLGIDRRAIGVARGAADDLFRPGEPDPGDLALHGLRRDAYVLHVGSFVPRKNIPFLLEAWRDSGVFREGFELVFAGAGGWKRPEITGERVRTLEAVPDSALLSLYRGSRAVVLPSSFEGLGLPALEAVACGCALLSSDSSALPETVGDSGMLLPDGSLEAWAGALRRLSDDAFIAALRGKALAAERLRSVDSAASALAFYREIAK